MWEVDGPIPPSNPGRKRIVRVTWTNPEQFVILCDRPRSKLMHWVAGRSQLCTMQEGGCAACAPGVNPLWRFFVYAHSGPGHEPIFLDLTKAAIDQLKLFTQDRDSLRGTMIKVSKTRGGKNGRFIVTVLERRLDADSLPPAESVDELLDYLVSCKR